MHRSWLLVLALLLISAPAVSQSTSSDSGGTQALVAEVRQLRKDLQSTNGYALKAQVLLYYLQVQEATVARVSQHLNDVRSKHAAIQEHQRQLVSTMKYYEKIADDSAASPAQQKEAQQQVSSIKTELPSVAAQEQQEQTAEMEAEEQLRAEQAKLGGLEDRVDRLEKEFGSNPQ
jgi:chromosome segregation ATPase